MIFIIFVQTTKHLNLKRPILSLLLVLTVLISFSKNYSAQEKYLMERISEVDDVNEYFSELITKRNPKYTEEEMKRVLENPRIQESKKFPLSIVKTGFRILPRRGDVGYSENLDLYIQIVDFLSQKDEYIKHLKVWVEMLNIKSKHNKVVILKFLKRSKDFFINNDLMAIGQLSWHTDSRDYELFIKKKRLFIKYNNDITLKAKRRQDSIVIYETKGGFTFTKNIWYGKGGNLDWKRAGNKDIYATIDGKYQVSLKNARIKFKNSTLYNLEQLDKPIKGVLEDNLANSERIKKRYPRFTSKSDEIVLNKLSNNFSYKGQIQQYSTNIKGVSSKNKSSNLLYEDTVGIKIEFPVSEVNFREGNIISPESPFKLSYKKHKDILRHNNIKFEYDKKQGALKLRTIYHKTLKAKFYDTYHNLAFNTKNLVYLPHKKKILFTNFEVTSHDKPRSVFVSGNYFDKNFFLSVFGYHNTHPFSMISSYKRKYPHEEVIYLDDFSDYIKKDQSQVKLFISDLAARNYVYYNNKKNYFIPEEKLFNDLKYFSKRKDYDQIRFVNIPNRKNNIGHIDLTNMRLTLYNTEVMEISKNKSVYVYPNTTLNYDRKNDFTTGGVLSFGSITLLSDNLAFNYKKYMFNFNNAKKMYIDIHTGKFNNQGEKIKKRVSSAIENITGFTIIDYPNNKSGNIKSPEYPIINSKEKSNVYWESKKIARGKYKKEDFYYIVDPFILDSLSEHLTNSIKFEGLFTPTIFPSFRQTLSVQKDYSLGFIESYPEPKVAYKKASFLGELKLNSRGLQGSGNLKYKQYNLYAKKMLFLPEHYSCLVDSSYSPAVPKDNIPSLRLKKSPFTWDIPTDNIGIRSTRRGIVDIGDVNTNSLQGKLTIKNNKFRAKGKVRIGNISLKSDTLDFTYKKTLAKFAEIKAYDSTRFGNFFEADMVDLDITIKDLATTVIGADTNQLYVFPINEFLAMGSKIKGNLKTGKFETADSILTLFSTRDDMEDVVFRAKKLSYNFKKGSLDIAGINKFKVYTSDIELPNNTISVKNGGSFDKIRNARMYLDETRYHRLIDATIDINSGESYRAKGRYLYIDRLDKIDTLGVVRLSREKEGIAGWGKINKKDNFKLSPEFSYHGKFKVNSLFKGLEAKGTIKPLGINKKFKPREFKVNFKFNRDSIYIPLNQLRRRIAVGPLFTFIGNSIDGSYFSRYNFMKSKKIINTDSLYATSNTSTFMDVVDKAKMDNLQNYGEKFSFNKKTGEMFGKAKLELAKNFGMIDVKTFGSFKFKKRNDFTTNSATSFELKLKPELENRLAEFLLNSLGMREISKAPVDSTATEVEVKEEDDINPNFNRPARSTNNEETKKMLIDLGIDEDDINEEFMCKYVDRDLVESLVLLYDKEFARQYILNFFDDIDDLGFSLDEKYKLPSLLFSNIDFKYERRSKSFISVSNIDLLSIGEHKFDKSIQGIIELKPRRNFSGFAIYLKKDEAWLLLDYRLNKLEIATSDHTIGKFIEEEIEESERKFENEEKRQKYEYSNFKDKSYENVVRRYQAIVELREAQEKKKNN